MKPARTQSISIPEQGSKISLRSLFGGKKIYPIIADVVYGTDDEVRQTRQSNIRSLSIDSNVEMKKDRRNFLSKFIDIIKREWIIRKEEKLTKGSDEFIKATLRDLFIYIIFLILLIIIAFGQANMNYYYFNTRINDNIMGTNFGAQSSFHSIKCMADVWNYINNNLLENIFWKSWYNTPDNVTTFDSNLIYMDDKIVGVVRLRILRVKLNTCSIPSFFRKNVVNCYDQYSIQNSDHTSFGPANDTAWIYQALEEGYTHSGDIGTYESGGFIQLLTQDQESSLAIIQYLYNNLWLDRSTRVLFIDYTVYNSNVDLFCVVKLVIEFPPSGGAYPKIEMRTLKLFRYVNSFDYFILCCEVVFTIFTFYYILEEIIQMCKHRIRYLFDFWNIIDIFLVIISLSCIMINVYRSILVNSKINMLLQDQHPNFDFASYWQKIYNEAICINVFLAWVKVYRYIKFNKTMTQFTATLARSSKDLMGFSIMFCIVFLAFSQSAFFLFSNKIQDYRRFEVSIFALFRIILGDFNFQDIYNAHNILGPLFFIIFIFFVFFILMSMFVAIINGTFIQVKHDIDKIKEDYNIAKFFKKQILDRLKKNKIIKIQEVLEKGNIMNLEELTFHDWRRELLQHGYAEVEIQALFMKYDHDGDRVLDFDERKKMLEDIKERRLNLLEPIEDEVQNLDYSTEKEFVSRELMNDLSSRINRAENGLMEILQKIDQVLAFLARSEKAKLDHQKDMSYTLQILTNSRGTFQN